MLTAELVHARRLRGELRLVRLDDAATARALDLAGAHLALLHAHVGSTRDELDEALDAIVVGASDRLVAGGLRKLAEDACRFEAEDALDAEELRREVFLRATTARNTAALDGRFDRDAILAAIAAARGTTVDVVEQALFSDLRSAQRLREAPSWTAAMLLEQWELGRAQAVLLRAVRVVVDVKCSAPAALRALFHKLKFHRLLFTIARAPPAAAASSEASATSAPSEVQAGGDGHRIEIDGPFSMFEATTKYGLQLAMLLPALRECDHFVLRAEVRWGKARDALVFRAVGGCGPPQRALALAMEDERPQLTEEVEALLRGLRALGTPWLITAAPAILELPGIGLCVPDLCFTDPRRRLSVYLEVMGHWSRAAVWRRVELIEAGLPHRIVFAVSERLRVSEEVIGGEVPAAIYVYKGKMSARSVMERVERVATAR